MTAFTILDGLRAAGPLGVEVDARIDGERVRIPGDAVREGLGWQLRPEGLCREGVCIPVRDREALAAGEGLDLEELAGLLDRPLALDVAERAAALGAGHVSRAAALASLEAPDFSLPDLDGELYALSAQRGRKVLLVAYASW